MSNFIFGNIILETNLNALEDIEKDIWDICEFAIKKRIHLMLGCNIPQQIIYEMIGHFKINNLNDKIPFLITENPLYDVIDKLIIAGDMLFDFTIQKNLDRIIELLQFCLNKKRIKLINLFFAEGYDDNFKEIELKIDKLKDEIINILSQSYDFPSVKYIISV